MGKTNKFLGYLEDNFFGMIYGAVSAYIIATRCYYGRLRSYVDVMRCDVPRERMTLCRVWPGCDDLTGTEIRWDVKARADAVCRMRDEKGSYLEAVPGIEILVSMRGDIGKKFADCEITGVRECDAAAERKLTMREGRLDGDLVPVIPRTEYEAWGNLILAKYFPEALTKPMPTDPSAIARACGATIVERPITADGKTLGRFYPEKCEEKLCDFSRGGVETVFVAADTILIDTASNCALSPYSANDTSVHEIIHRLLHKVACLFRDIAGEGRAIADAGEADFAEIQANGITPYVLLPGATLFGKIRELWEKSGSLSSDVRKRCFLTLRAFADFYKVPVSTAKKRLRASGSSVEGLCAWIDGHRVRDYVYGAGALREYETYTISERVPLERIFIPGALKNQLDAGRLVFAENHLSANEGRYVERGRGAAVLTGYALRHMDECCVKFAPARCRHKDFLEYVKKLGIETGRYDYVAVADEKNNLTEACLVRFGSRD